MRLTFSFQPSHPSRACGYEKRDTGELLDGELPGATPPSHPAHRCDAIRIAGSRCNNNISNDMREEGRFNAGNQ